MADVRELIRRFRKGQSARRVARDLGLSRNTVARYLEWARAEGLLGAGPLPSEGEFQARLVGLHRRERPPGQASLVEPFRERVSKLRAQGVEARAIWQILRDEHDFDGSYSAVKRFVRKLEGARTPRGTLRLEVAPGEEAQVDFGYAGRFYDPDTDQVRRAWVFVMVLSFSRHMYAELVFDQSLATWCRLHTAAFEFFGGVPERLILDNLKAAIVKASLYDPVVQRSYRELCEHYDLVVSPCRPRTPEHKGKVEKGGVHYVKRNALAGREFRDVHAGNAHLRRWCLDEAGRRVHGTTRQIPLDVFERVERAALRLLPPTRWQLCEWKQCKLHPDCHVVFEKAYYSAPYRLIGRRLMVRATASQVQIFHDHQLVATHRRALRAGQRRTVRDHLPPDKVVWIMQNPVWCREHSRQIGPATGELIERLLGDRPLDRLRSAQGILRLAKRFGPQRLEAACARALHYDEIRYHTVRLILDKDLDLEPLSPVETPPTPPSSPPRHARSWTEFFPDTASQRRIPWN